MRLRLEAPASASSAPSLSSFALATILSFSSSLSSEEETIAFDTIFFLLIFDVPVPPSCSRNSFLLRILSFFRSALVFFLLDRLLLDLLLECFLSELDLSCPPCSLSLPELTISPSSRLRPLEPFLALALSSLSSMIVAFFIFSKYSCLALALAASCCRRRSSTSRCISRCMRRSFSRSSCCFFRNVLSSSSILRARATWYWA